MSADAEGAPMQIDRMELLGVVVDDLDVAVARYSRLFGVEFHIFTPTVDYTLAVNEAGEDPVPPLPARTRIAMDSSGCFELVELPGSGGGVRNIHFRVDDVEQAKAHFTGQGLRVVSDLMAGSVREVIFDPRDLDGVRCCLVHYDGTSFARALLDSASPPRVPGPRGESVSVGQSRTDVPDPR